MKKGQNSTDLFTRKDSLEYCPKMAFISPLVFVYKISLNQNKHKHNIDYSFVLLHRKVWEDVNRVWIGCWLVEFGLKTSQGSNHGGVVGA